jgi:hypothetical protein
MMANSLVLPSRSCVSCKFYTPPDGTPNALGECHRFPPTFTVFPAPDGAGRVVFQNVVGFTQVQETMWCGEHKPKLAS